MPCVRRLPILRAARKNVMTGPAPTDASPSPRRRFSAPRLGFLLIVAALVAGIAFVGGRRRAYAAEIDRLRAAMTDVERRRAEGIVARERDKIQVALALLRRQARVEAALHLSVSVDSQRMYLEREGALLRDMPVLIGAERRVGIAPDTVRLAAPRGVRTVARVLSGQDAWEVPAWVYHDRGAPVDSTRSIVGALGPVAVLLDGGTILYSTPDVGPLADSSYVMPGAVRARPDDLRAILPNLTPGMRVYFY